MTTVMNVNAPVGIAPGVRATRWDYLAPTWEDFVRFEDDLRDELQLTQLGGMDGPRDYERWLQEEGDIPEESREDERTMSLREALGDNTPGDALVKAGLALIGMCLLGGLIVVGATVGLLWVFGVI